MNVHCTNPQLRRAAVTGAGVLDDETS
jgi:hypothetical protein